MNIKKLVIMSLLALLISCSLSSAFASDDNEVNINENILTLHDVKFNIPDGYKEDESQRKIGETSDDGKYSTCVFVNGDKTIKMTVKYGSNSLEYSVEGKEVITLKTIKNTAGYATRGTPIKFMYEINGNQATIEAPDEATVEQVIYDN